jgi:hypothetical protein
MYPEFIDLLTINPALKLQNRFLCYAEAAFVLRKLPAILLFSIGPFSRKYRIRKRLNIPTETDIYQFFDDLA